MFYHSILDDNARHQISADRTVCACTRVGSPSEVNSACLQEAELLVAHVRLYRPQECGQQVRVLVDVSLVHSGRHVVTTPSSSTYTRRACATTMRPPSAVPHAPMHVSNSAVWMSPPDTIPEAGAGAAAAPPCCSLTRRRPSEPPFCGVRDGVLCHELCRFEVRAVHLR